jgi:transposase
LVAPQHLPALRRAVPEWLEDAQNGLSGRFRTLLGGLYRKRHSEAACSVAV